MIDAQGLTRRFDRDTVIGPFDLAIPAGSVLAVLGPNGAGKTTLIRLLAALVAPSAGTARVAGYDLRQAAQQVRASVGLVTDVLGLDPQQTPDEYLRYLGALYGIAGAAWQQRIGDLYAVFGLAEVRAQRIATLSLGTRQKVALCRALLHQPPVLLLDEPTNGLDPIAAQVVHRLIRDYRAAGRAVVLCTHDLPLAEDLADSVLILANGRIVHHAPLDLVDPAAPPARRSRLERLFFDSVPASQGATTKPGGSLGCSIAAGLSSGHHGGLADRQP